MNKYGVLPIEPKSFKRSIRVKINEQVPLINPVDTDFASIFIGSAPPHSISYLDQPIKTDISIKSLKPYMFSYSLSEDTNTLLKKINKDKYNSIELKNVPHGISSYIEYETFILDYISSIENTNIYLNCVYTLNIIKNSKKYKIKGICITQYGVCSNKDPELIDLFTYNITNSTLLGVTKSLSPIELLVQTNAACSQLEELSNTFGSQLWLFDFLFQLTHANIKKAFIDISSFNNAYTIMAFSYATRGSPVPYTANIKYGTSLTPNIPIYIMKNNSEYLISIIHKDAAEENIEVNIATSFYNTGQLARYICNQTVKGTNGITFGEVTFDDSTGLPINVVTREETTKVTTTSVPSNNGVYTFIMNKMSIAILSIPISTGGAYFDNINEEDEENTIVTIRPDPLNEYYDSIPTTMSVKNFKKDYQMEL